MIDPRSSHQVANTNYRASVPEVLSLPSASIMLSTDKLNEHTEEETSRSSSELQSVSSYNSLSSLSSCGSERGNAEQSICSDGSATSRPRSIFKTYWESSGDSPLMTRAHKSSRSVTTHATASVSSWGSDEESAANSYERILKHNEGVKTRRRSIFGSQYQSMPSLARPYHPAPLERRGNSTSELEKRRLPSCLRSSPVAARARSSSVSFDCEVSVITFNSHLENWAAEGWSKRFQDTI